MDEKIFLWIDEYQEIISVVIRIIIIGFILFFIGVLIFEIIKKIRSLISSNVIVSHNKTINTKEIDVIIPWSFPILKINGKEINRSVIIIIAIGILFFLVFLFSNLNRKNNKRITREPRVQSSYGENGSYGTYGSYDR